MIAFSTTRMRENTRNSWEKEWGYSSDADVRQPAYWSVMSGAAGHVYGHHSIWQFWSPGKERINFPIMPWRAALTRPGAGQMQHLRKLVESRPLASLLPAPDLIEDALEGADHIAAARGDGYAFVYSPNGRAFSVHLALLKAARLRVTWWNPRTGQSEGHESFTVVPNEPPRRFVCPAEGFGADWVLMIDDEARGF